MRIRQRAVCFKRIRSLLSASRPDPAQKAVAIQVSIEPIDRQKNHRLRKNYQAVHHTQIQILI